MEVKEILAQNTVDMNPEARRAYFAGLKDTSPNEAAYYEMAADYYRELVNLEGRQFADSVVSGTLDEAVLDRAGIKVGKDGSGNINSVEFNGKTIPVVIEKKPFKATDRHTGKSGYVRGFYLDGTIHLVVPETAADMGKVHSYTATPVHEMNHALLEAMANDTTLTPEQKQVVDFLYNDHKHGGKFWTDIVYDKYGKPLYDENGKMVTKEVDFNEKASQFVERVFNLANRDFTADRDVVSVKNIISNVGKALVDEKERAEILTKVNEAAKAHPYVDAHGNKITVSPRMSLVDLGGENVAVVESEPLTTQDAQDEDKVYAVLSAVIGQQYDQLGETVKVNVDKAFADEFWGSSYSSKLRRKHEKLWRAKVSSVPILGDILKTTPLGAPEPAKHFNKDFKQTALFYRSKTKFGITRWDGVAVYPCELIVFEHNGRRFIYDIVKIEKPTVTAKTNLPEETVRRLYNGTQADKSASTDNIPQKDNSRKSLVTPEEDAAYETAVKSGDIRYSISHGEWDALESHFGTTADAREAGYILPNGHMLDFSGRHRDFIKNAHMHDGRREVDHRDVREVLRDRGYGMADWMYVQEMLDAGAIRTMPEGKALVVSRDINKDQEDAIYDWVDGMADNDGGFSIEMYKDGVRTPISFDLPDKTSARAIINKIHDYFAGRADLQKKADVTLPSASEEIKGMGRLSPETPDIRYSLVTDSKVIDEFADPEKTIETYRTFQVVDGKLYSPMAAKVATRVPIKSGKNKGKLRNKYEWAEHVELGKVYKADEHPENAHEINGKWYTTLNKGNGSSLDDIAYNPYWHSSNLVLNDQFTSAWERPNLVTVKCRILKSDVGSGYHADKAHLPTGRHEWHSGTVAAQLPNNNRDVFLTQYLMPVEIMSDTEVAKMYKQAFGGKDIAVPETVVPPSLRDALKAEGIRVTPRDAGDGRYSFADEAKALIERKRPDLNAMDLMDSRSFYALSEDWKRQNGGRFETKGWKEFQKPAMLKYAVDQVMKFPDSKSRKAALHWFIKGAIKLPEDAPKENCL